MDNANKHLPRRKRSMRITLALMGAGAASTLVGCGNSTPPETLSNVEFDDTETYRSVEECVEGGIYTQQTCQSAYEEARRDVPSYRDEEWCEELYGEGACEKAPKPDVAIDNWFMPAMMGFMVGNMTASSSRGHMVNHHYQEPIYRTRDNQDDWSAATAAASSRMRGVESSIRTTVRTENRAARNSRSSSYSSSRSSSYSSSRATSRSGFGSRSSARGGFGS
ncbi:hypothetical protein CVH10_07780 [Halomonas sp. ND22Bw]|uniref:DUF1190 domain-containing protein n=1 Tax=Halomonas sp. ND22Bw TaxID=2054178 RepID=UPI000D0B943E|nr:hypothetical protein CVH10_07780 [Halomonas sp. ND22Bw]